MRPMDNRLIAPAVGLLALAAYWPVARVVENNFQAEVLRVAQATVMSMLFVLFVLALRKAFSRTVPDSARRFYLGLTLWASAAGAGALWRLLWRLGGGGDDLAWMLSNDSASFLLWMEIVGAFFMISGPAVRDKAPAGELPLIDPDSISWPRVGLAIVLCAATTYAVTFARIGAEHVHVALGKLRGWVP